ncbi:MAG: BMP family ABC transporter substrate-binding protein, partial [Candidatus Auribacterota bacterium]|nr:BMP family ABC transporter substrate-binding protein [Candidatus Auribacterota bacterium]
LMGIMAGMMTKTNVIGAVAAYPYPQINLPINAYKAGAKSVNPDIKLKMTYIESWFDPPKAKQSALAQIASGADFVYAERFGPFEACKEKGIYGFGHWVDQNSMAPEVVLSSAVALWDPVMNKLVDIWWEHTTEGVPYDAPMEMIQYNMAEGASDIAPYHGLAVKVPEKVKNTVEKTRDAIKSGKLKVPYIDTPAKSD